MRYINVMENAGQPSHAPKHPLGKPVDTPSVEAWAVLVRAALAEDWGAAGDITGRSTIPEASRSTARLVARASGILCGIQAAEQAFRAADAALAIVAHKHDGDALKAGDIIADISGSTRAILAAERVALNFLTHLSGIATLTGRFVVETAGTRAVIACTRKTIPGLRHIEKYAVRMGGGANHRFGLYDGVLIKDNHVAAAGSVYEAVMLAKKNAPAGILVEVEVDRPDQIDEALQAGADIIMLDNFSLPDMRAAVVKISGRAAVEASGGVNLRVVRQIAETGVDIISVGALTHSAPALDIALDF